MAAHGQPVYVGTHAKCIHDPNASAHLHVPESCSSQRPPLKNTPFYPPQMDDLLSRLSMAKDKISDTENLISIDLDHRHGVSDANAGHSSQAYKYAPRACALVLRSITLHAAGTLLNCAFAAQSACSDSSRIREPASFR